MADKRGTSQRSIPSIYGKGIASQLPLVLMCKRLPVQVLRAILNPSFYASGGAAGSSEASNMMGILDTSSGHSLDTVTVHVKLQQVSLERRHQHCS